MTQNFLGGNIEPREYQINIFNSAREFNTLVVLPTGLGKTVIAAMLAEYILFEKNEKVLFLAPTRPLVMQHLATMKRLFSTHNIEISAFTGEIDNEDRLLLWTTSRLIISTPQVAENDLRNGLFDISRFGLIVFDEAHRATGNYAYSTIARHFLEARKRLVLGITASPGSDREKLDEITRTLGIERVIIKSEHDQDVEKYIGGIKIEVVKLELPQYIRNLSSTLKKVLRNITEKLREAGFMGSGNFSRSEMAKKITEVVQRARTEDSKLFGIIPYMSAAIRIDYLLEYLETQGIEIAWDYVSQILSGQDKTLRRTASILQKMPEFREFMNEFNSLMEEKPDNLKMITVLRLCEDRITENPDSRIIVFTHFRKTSDLLTEFLSTRSRKIRPVRFIGQSSKGEDAGIRQKDQDAIIRNFRENTYNVMVATSVAEEGLDIPSTDLVIFFEPVPSEIRSIQRRGRTGRTHAGDVKILMYMDTRDSAYYYSSIRKEARMKTNIERVSNSFHPEPAPKKRNFNLDDFIN